MESMPKDLPQAIHNALRSWYTGGHSDPLWSEMLIVAQRLAEQPAFAPDLAIKSILKEALDVLDEQAKNDMARILRLRFLDDLKARTVAASLNLSESIVFKLQRTAIKKLADIIWRTESDARSAKVARIAERLEIQEPSRLFGVDDKLAELTTILTAEVSYWLVAVVGIGGIGKTSLADAAVRKVAHTSVFADIGWVSARQDRFTLWGGLLEDAEGNPALTYEGLLDAIVEQFGFWDLTRLPLAEKHAGLRARFKAQSYLVVVDNLETAADYSTLVPNLETLINPSKFLLTSRHSLHEYPDVYNLSLDELSAQDSLALLRHEAGKRRLLDVATISDEILLQVYEVTGGNPLALKLLVGQMHILSLPQVVEDLCQARGQTVEELYRFIYRRSWHLLTEEARRVLITMPLVAESGGGLEQISMLSKLDNEQLTTALKQLVILSLINVGGTVEARRYSIHRLTETFLRNEVLKWQIES